MPTSERLTIASTGALPTTAPRTRPLAEFWHANGWIVGRLATGVLIILATSVIVYAVTLLLPGDAAQVILGRNATPEKVEALRARLGLDQPPVTQYLNWMAGILQGDFGTSLVSQQPVVNSMVPRLMNTLVLVGLAALIGYPLALLIGVTAAMRSGRAWDTIVNTSSIVLSALPEFVIAILLVFIFSTGVLHWLPGISLVPDGGGALSNIPGLVLPVATVVLMVAPYLVRQVRASVGDTLQSEYAVMAEMKGLPVRVVTVRHVLRNALVPYVQAGTQMLAFMLGGTVIVETLFQYPGIGYALVNAVTQRDIPVLQFIVMIMAFGFVVFNLLADVLTVLLTPKLRTR